MVVRWSWAVAGALLQWTQAGKAAPEGPPLLLRAKLLMALLAFLLLGLLMFAIILLAGRRARRQARQKPPARPPIIDAWHAKPLVPPLEEPSDPPSPTDDADGAPS